MISTKTYIIAVSGGVDSVVLLHKLISKKPKHIKYVVAHFDHGIRKDSKDDCKFVEQLAKENRCAFEHSEGRLGEDASEDVARDARYKFLRDVKKKYKAEAIITAHHKDDVAETMILNIIRGNGYRGLIGYTQSDIVRPLIIKSKKDLIDYAQKNNLQWREDSTNQDMKYLRNYVRLELMPIIKDRAEELLRIRLELVETVREIDDISSKMLVQVMEKQSIFRSKFVTLPYIVQKELIATYFRLFDIEYDKQMIENATIAIKVLNINKHVELSKNATLYSKKNQVVIKCHPQSV